MNELEAFLKGCRSRYREHGRRSINDHLSLHGILNYGKRKSMITRVGEVLEDPDQEARQWIAPSVGMRAKWTHGLEFMPDREPVPDYAAHSQPLVETFGAAIAKDSFAFPETSSALVSAQTTIVKLSERKQRTIGGAVSAMTHEVDIRTEKIGGLEAENAALRGNVADLRAEVATWREMWRRQNPDGTPPSRGGRNGG
jgi:hypothetical protein